MESTEKIGEELFAKRSRQIESTVKAVAMHRRLSVDDAQELYAQVMLKVVQDDYAVLRTFKGKSTWGTYLRVIVQRVLLDHRVKEWGRWRPSAQARRLGVTAVSLDRLINRDGLETPEAIQQLLLRGIGETTVELERLAERIPRRPQRRFVSGDACLKTLIGQDEADWRIKAAERRRSIAKLSTGLLNAVRELPDDERSLLGMRFGRGWTVRRIAASQNLAVRPLYRRFRYILRRLRRHLEHRGLCRKEIVSMLDGRDFDLDLDLRELLSGLFES